MLSKRDLLFIVKRRLRGCGPLCLGLFDFCFYSSFGTFIFHIRVLCLTHRAPVSAKTLMTWDEMTQLNLVRDTFTGGSDDV
jgi:hypothetical protein